MSNSFFNHTNRLVRFDSARAEDLNALLDAVASGLDGVEVKTNAAIKLPNGETAVALPAAGSRANKVMSFDALGALTTNDVSVSDIAAANANAATATAGQTQQRLKQALPPPKPVSPQRKRLKPQRVLRLSLVAR